MSRIVGKGTSKAAGDGKTACPYLTLFDVCYASITLTSPSEGLRSEFCHSDDYDDCPIFLSKILRRK